MAEMEPFIAYDPFININFQERNMALIPFDDRDGSIWFDGEMVPWRDAKTHGLSHGLHYAFWYLRRTRLFRPSF